jgi:uncharacterized protein with NRDE domain
MPGFQARMLRQQSPARRDYRSAPRPTQTGAPPSVCLIVFSWHPPGGLPAAAGSQSRRVSRAAPARPLPSGRTTRRSSPVATWRPGGTWLGVSRRGRIAAVTNIRDPETGERASPRSRGDLTRDFLTSTLSCPDYLESVAWRAGDYLGFNLLISDGKALWYLHGGRGEDPAPRALPAGLYGLSNAALDVPWPKVERAGRTTIAAGHRRGRTGSTLSAAHCAEPSPTRRRAAAAALAAQGLAGKMAQRLSAQFIVTPQYGTRCCSTLRWRRDGHLEFTEQRFDSAGLVSGESRTSTLLRRARPLVRQLQPVGTARGPARPGKRSTRSCTWAPLSRVRLPAADPGHRRRRWPAGRA